MNGNRGTKKEIFKPFYLYVEDYIPEKARTERDTKNDKEERGVYIVNIL